MLKQSSKKTFNKQEINNKLKTITNIFLFLFILNLLAGNLGIFNSYLTRFFAFFLLLTTAFVNINFRNIVIVFKHKSKHSREKISTSLLLMIASCIILFSFFIREIWLMQLPIFILGLNFLLNELEKPRNELYPLAITSFFYAFFIIIIQNVPFIFNLLQQFSLLISSRIGYLSKPILLGASASGFWIVLTFLFYIGVLFFLYKEHLGEKRNLSFLMYCIFGILTSWIVYIFIQSLTPFKTTTDAINSQYIIFLINSVIIILPVIKNFTTKPSIQTKKLKKNKIKKSTAKWRIISVCLLLLASGIFMTTFPPVFSNEEKRNIAIYFPEMDGNISDAPEYGSYGKYAAGIFGLLPEYLASFNYNIEIINESITQENLQRNNVLVIINLNEIFSHETFDQIWNFVEQGGSLLVLGDHTDIFGIRKPLNTLLKPVGIRFRFDSALPIKSHWSSGFHPMHHPINERIITEDQFSISVGASLELSGSSFPLVLGKGGFSDIGDYQSNSYLGDYTWNPGEQLSDITLVAGAYYGTGKVVVFGDTSTFQNVVLSNSYLFTSNIFTWLTSSYTPFLHYVMIFFSLLLFSLAYFIYVKSGKSLFCLFPIILCISLIFSSIVNPIIVGEPTIMGSISFVDISHNERFDKELFEQDSITGFMINILRNRHQSGNRYLPRMLYDFSEEKIEKSKILILIAPTKLFSNDEVDVIERYALNGGLVILSVGYNDKTASCLILERFGFNIQALPLGPVPYVEENPQEHQREPRFVDAWPITIENPDNKTRVLYSFKYYNENYALAVFKKWGEGGIILFGDSQFFLDKNLESSDVFWPGNILFIRSIFSVLEEEGIPK